MVPFVAYRDGICTGGGIRYALPLPSMLIELTTGVIPYPPLGSRVRLWLVQQVASGRELQLHGADADCCALPPVFGVKEGSI